MFMVAEEEAAGWMDENGVANVTADQRGAPFNLDKSSRLA